MLNTRFVRQILTDSQYEFHTDIEENQTREFNGLIWLNGKSGVRFLQISNLVSNNTLKISLLAERLFDSTELRYSTDVSWL
jgi:hypothetical protein